VDEGQADAGVDGEVVHSLFGLLDQGVAIDLPGQVLSDAAHLLERLVDRNGTDRHRRVAHDPVASGVDVASGGEVHHVVRTPADRPDQFLDLLLDGGRHRGIADVRVDLDGEVAPDRHRLDFRMVDVGRNDGAAASDFGAHELGCDQFGNAGAHRVAAQPPFAVGIAQVFAHPFALAVLAQRHVFHLRGDDAASRVVHLGHVEAGLGAARRPLKRLGAGA
jgi:hypothetical protein